MTSDLEYLLCNVCESNQNKKEHKMDALKNKTVVIEYDENNRGTFPNQTIKNIWLLDGIAIGAWNGKVVFSWSPESKTWYVK